jgi:hypothetical protein
MEKISIHLPPVSTTPVVHLEPQISPQIFENLVARFLSGTKLLWAGP